MTWVCSIHDNKLHFFGWLPMPLSLINEPVVYLFWIEPRRFGKSQLLRFLHINRYMREWISTCSDENRYLILPKDKAIWDAGSTNQVIVALLPWVTFLSFASSGIPSSDFQGSHCTFGEAVLWALDPLLGDLCSSRHPYQCHLHLRIHTSLNSHRRRCRLKLVKVNQEFCHNSQNFSIWWTPNCH